MKKLSTLFLVSLLSGATTLGAYKYLEHEHVFSSSTSFPKSVEVSNTHSRNVGLSTDVLDFTEAADKAVHSVVHVKNVSYRTVSNPMLEYFYGAGSGRQQQEQVGTGSGVIISEDGYIVTNNHVIKDASDIEITLNNRKSYKAELIGTDSKMDIALLKIKADEKLPYSIFANSDAVRVGEWVLAVGNPYNLTSTVTAGIVSAKARNLGTGGIQSFIQTDAAVNPGNSGGALVNTRGELVGINTMISSMTGSYVGYSFAVPSNIARKIIEDIMEFGNVQRAIIGIEGAELNSAVSKEYGLSLSQGFFVTKVNKDSGAEKAGIKKGDVIVRLDTQPIYSFADFSGYVNTKRPNDVVQVSFLRDGKTYQAPVRLITNEFISTEFKGLELIDLDASDKKRLRIDYGVKIKDVTNENLIEYTNDLKGAVIVKIGNNKADDVETVSRILSQISETQAIQIELITTAGQRVRLII